MVGLDFFYPFAFFKVILKFIVADPSITLVISSTPSLLLLSSPVCCYLLPCFCCLSSCCSWCLRVLLFMCLPTSIVLFLLLVWVFRHRIIILCISSMLCCLRYLHVLVLIAIVIIIICFYKFNNKIMRSNARFNIKY